MQGKRIYESPLPYLNPGEYGKAKDGTWWICSPNGIHGRIKDSIWKIIEHEDGTITASPSILLNYPQAPTDCNPPSWHGYLEKGVWKEC
jgi:hypothetical protein